MSSWQFLVGLWHELQPLALIAVGWFVLLVGPPLRGRIKNTETRQWLELLQQIMEWAVATMYQRSVRGQKDPKNVAAGEFTHEQATSAKNKAIEMVRLAVPHILASLKARGYSEEGLLDMLLEAEVVKLNQRLSQRPPPASDTPEVDVPAQDRVPADLVQGLDPATRTITPSGHLLRAVRAAVKAETTQQLRALRDTPPEIPGAKK